MRAPLHATTHIPWMPIAVLKMLQAAAEFFIGVCIVAASTPSLQKGFGEVCRSIQHMAQTRLPCAHSSYHLEMKCATHVKKHWTAHGTSSAHNVKQTCIARENADCAVGCAILVYKFREKVCIDKWANNPHILWLRTWKHAPHDELIAILRVTSHRQTVRLN